MWQVVADLGQIMISSNKNSVKNTTTNMYKKQIIFVEIDKNTNSKEKKYGSIIFLQYTLVNQKNKIIIYTHI
jgi:chemotaxis protein CheY-P-specific phosphatase CheC